MGRAESGLRYEDAERLVGADALKAASKTNQRSNWTTNRQLVPWSVIGPIYVAQTKRARRDGMAQETQDASDDRSTLDLLREAMDSIDVAAWQFFMEVLKHRNDTLEVEWSIIRNAIQTAMGLGPMIMMRRPRKPAGPSGKPRRTATKAVTTK